MCSICNRQLKSKISHDHVYIYIIYNVFVSVCICMYMYEGEEERGWEENKNSLLLLKEGKSQTIDMLLFEWK